MSEPAYSPRLRTGVLLCGAGTAGAYHAGVLKALAEAGVKLDLLAGHGAGAMSALCGAIDGVAGANRAAECWTDPRLKRAYRWRPGLRATAIAFLAAGLALALPLFVLVVAAVLYAASLLTALVNLTGVSASLVDAYRRSIEILFAPPLIPTIVPRTMVLALLVGFIILAVAAVRAAGEERSRRRIGGAFWWRLVGAPLDAAEPATRLIETLWQVVRGASHAPRPAASEIGRKYVDLLIDNFGQPGFCEVMIGVHDLDGRRDLVGAVLPDALRPAFLVRRDGLGPREAESIDLAGPSRDLLVDLLAAAQRLPVAAEPYVMTFPTDHFWRGESHRLCDRPELAVRLVDEIASLGIEQIVIVSASAPAAAPHAMRARPGDLRARMGEMARSIETSVLQDAWTAATARFSGVFLVRPDHNPIGPFDFAGAYDESSDRRRTVAELVQQGYADAYREFIEPVVAAGDRVDEEVQ